MGGIERYEPAEGDNRGISEIFPYFPDSLDFGIFRGILESGRYIGGILDHMGSISMKYGPKPSHMDLKQTNFRDFVPNLAYLNLFHMYIFCSTCIWQFLICLVYTIYTGVGCTSPGAGRTGRGQPGAGMAQTGRLGTAGALWEPTGGRAATD